MQKDCTVSIGSVTQAMRAKELLGAASLRVRVVKSESGRRGCVYGLSYPCEARHLLETVLKEAGYRLRGGFRS